MLFRKTKRAARKQRRQGAEPFSSGRRDAEFARAVERQLLDVLAADKALLRRLR